jgi:hypothetical protein
VRRHVEQTPKSLADLVDRVIAEQRLSLLRWDEHPARHYNRRVKSIPEMTGRMPVPPQNRLLRRDPSLTTNPSFRHQRWDRKISRSRFLANGTWLWTTVIAYVAHQYWLGYSLCLSEREFISELLCQLSEYGQPLNFGGPFVYAG